MTDTTRQTYVPTRAVATALRLHAELHRAGLDEYAGVILPSPAGPGLWSVGVLGARPDLWQLAVLVSDSGAVISSTVATRPGRELSPAAAEILCILDTLTAGAIGRNLERITLSPPE